MRISILSLSNALRLWLLRAFSVWLLLAGASVSVWGQTNPTAQNLPYTQNFASLTGTFPGYPAGWQGWAIAGSAAATYPTAAPSATAVTTGAGANNTTSSGIYDFVGKLGMLSTGSALRAPVLAVNTTSKSNIQVVYTAATQGNGARIGAIGLQYRVGTTGTFTNVTGSEYTSTNTPANTTGTTSVGASTISVILPAACDNQAVVQLRWVHRDVSGSGNRPSFSIDDVFVNCTFFTSGLTNNTGTTVISCTNPTISLTATGGNAYLWTGGSSTNTAANTFSTAGTYTVGITDANACTATQSITITGNTTAPTAGITNNTASTVINCTNTAISVTATGGGTYSWSDNASTTASRSFSAPGTYTVTVTGANNCTATASITLTQDNTPPTVGITNNTGTTVLSCPSATSISVLATGAASYSWSGGATPATAANSFTAAGTYTVTGTGANGCTNTASITVTGDITPPPAGITNNSGTTVLTCATTSISATATGGVSYAWSGGATPTTAANTFSAAGTYTVTVTGANGCTNTASLTITSNTTAPSASLANNGPLTCVATSATLTATASGQGALSYDFGSGFGAGNTSSVATPNTYSVTVQDAANGCTATANTTVAQNITAPSAVLSNTGPLTCSQTFVTLIANTSMGQGVLSFDFGSGFGASAVSGVNTPNTYGVTVQDAANGCTATANTTVTQNLTAPTASLTNDGPLTCTQTTVTLDASASSGTGALSFDFGSGFGISSNTTVSSANTYSVTVRDAANGCTATANTLVTNSATVTAAISGNNYTCNGGTTTLTASGGTSYVWNDGTSNIGTSAMISVPAGTYIVTAIDGGCSDTETITVTNTAVSVSISGNTVACNGGTTTLTATGTGILSYAWDNTATTAATTVGAGAYSVTVTGANGCTATASTTVTNTNVSASIAGDNFTCNGGTTALTASGGASYVWNDGTSNIGTSAMITVGAGAYSVTSSDNGCTAVANITVTNTTIAAAITGSPVTCDGGTTTLTANGGSSYAWSNSDITAATTVAAGTYTVTVTGANGCSATANTTVTDYASPSVTTTGITPACGATTADLTTAITSSTAGLTVEFFSDATFTTTATNPVSVAGTYYVKVSNAQGCFGTGSIVVDAFPASAAISITATPGTAIYTNMTATFTATISNGVSVSAYQWQVNGANVGTNSATYSTDALTNGQIVTCIATAPSTCATTSNSLTMSVSDLVFQKGNLVTLRLGEGTETMSALGNSLFLDQFTPTGTAGTSVAIPSTGATPIVGSGGSTSEGQLSLAADSSILVFGAYRSARLATGSVSGNTSAVTPRAIVAVNVGGTQTIATTSTTLNSANNFRGSVANGTGDYWGTGTGTNAGLNYFGTGTASSVSTTVTNLRWAGIFGGDLYVTTQSGSARILKVTGTPKISGQAANNFIALGAGASPYGFVFSPGAIVNGSVCYVADDRATTGGGVQKWTFDGTNWTLAYTLGYTTGTGGTSVGTRGITVDFSGTNPIIYATTAEVMPATTTAAGNRIIKIEDTGASSTATTLTTAANGTYFKGIAFSPKSVIASDVLLTTAGFNGNFGTISTGSSSTARSFTVSGTGLVGDVTITPPAGFQIRTGTNAFSSSPIVLAHTAGVLSNTVIDVVFAPTAVQAYATTINITSTGAITEKVSVVGTGIAPAAPVKFAVTAISPSSPGKGYGFSVTVQAQDALSLQQNTLTDRYFTLSTATGTGVVGGTIFGTIPAGTNTVTLTGVTYDVAETGVSIVAMDTVTTSGTPLTAGTSSTFTVLDAASQIAFVGVPSAGFLNTHIGNFSVQALRPDNSVDIYYNGSATLTLNTGTGNLSGTLTATITNGVATFTDVKFDDKGFKTLTATNGVFPTVNSINIAISGVPTVTEQILPQYMFNGSTTADRLQYVCRLTINDLIPNVTYRYITGASTNGALGNTSAPGNMYILNNTSGAAGFITGYSSAKGVNGSLMSANENTTGTRYGEFTTDNAGSYTGWFGMAPTANAVFANGSDVYFYVQMNNGVSGTSVFSSIRTTNTIKMVDATTARSVRGSSNAIAENMVLLYDNTAGTGRPLYASWAENDGITAASGATGWYTNVEATAGAWGAYIPNALANGVRRIESRSAATGALVGCPATDGDGAWPSGVNTVNPAVAATSVPLVFTSSDASLTPAYTVTATAGSNGSITGASSVPCGTNATYTIAPNACYEIVDVQVNGVSKGVITSYTFSNVTGDSAISATFSPIIYNITATVQAGNGTISIGGVPVSGGLVSVQCGNSVTLDFTPGSCDQIGSVSVNGTPVGAVSSYTFSNVTTNLQYIQVTFIPLLPTATSVNGCNYNAPAQLSATGSNNIEWYDDAARTNAVLGTGNTYTAPTAGTYYAFNTDGTCFSAPKAVVATVRTSTSTNVPQPTASNATYYATNEVIDGTWSHYCDCANDIRLLSIEKGTWNPGTLVSNESLVSNNTQYAVRVDVGDNNNVVKDITAAGYSVLANAWKVMNRTWDVKLFDVSQEPAGYNSATPTTLNIRSYYNYSDFAAINAAMTAASSATIANEADLTIYKLKNVSAPLGNTYLNSWDALQAGHAGVTDAQITPYHPTMAGAYNWSLAYIGGGDATSGARYAQYGITSFSGGGGGGGAGGAGAFPVEWLYFSGNLHENDGNLVTDLTWATANEVNANYFGVERSTEGKFFERIGTVKATGTATATTEYAFSDTHINANSNRLYYRLAQVDMDGTVHYSSTVEVQLNDGRSLRLMPNPVQDVLTLSISGVATDKAVFTLTDVTGATIRTENMSIGTQTVSMSDLATGVYFYEVRIGTSRFIGKLVKE